MSTGGPSGFGQGGLPNFYPGRGYPEAGSDAYRDMPNDFVGGARGVAALPSRTDPITPAGGGPAPQDPRIAGFNQVGEGGRESDGSGQQGPLWGTGSPMGVRRAPSVEDAGAPRICFDNVFGHGTVPWSRPFYANAAGLQSFHSPTQQPSWSANSALQADSPVSPIPVQRKKIGNFTVRRPFGDTSSGELFRNGSLADFVAGISQGMNMQGRRWLRQSKTHNPTLLNRSTYDTAGSYGQTTVALATQPVNTPGSNYGTY
jgi:hypothetical protein